MKRAELKAAIIQYLQDELGARPSKDMVSRTLGAIKVSIRSEDKSEWAESYFSSAKRQAKMIKFANQYAAIVDAEQAEAESLISEFYAEVEERFGDEALDSSGLPKLSGSDRQVNWAFQLRQAALNRCSNPEQVEKMQTLVLERKDAKYWIENYK